MDEQVKLFGIWSSPYSCRVVWALKLKGINYEFVDEDLRNKSDLLLQYNPVHKKIPVLAHGGKPIAESMIIIEYIDETWPENHPLLPKDPYERSVARFWTNFVDVKSSALRTCLFTAGEEQEKAIRETMEILRTIEEHARLGDENKKFFGGDTIGMTDLACGVLGHWLGVIEEVIEVKMIKAHTFPRLHAWIERFKEVPVIKDNLPNRDKPLLMSIIVIVSSLTMDEEEVKLFGNVLSTYCYRVVWALELKGVKYEYIKEDLRNKSDLLLHYNPVHKKVPVLVHGGNSVSESMVIVEYIEEAWPEKYPLLPKDPYERSVARFWAKFAENLDPTILRFICSLGEEQEKAMKEILEMLRSIEEHGIGGKKKFFGGDAIGFADLAFGRLVHMTEVIEEIVGVKLVEAHTFPSLYGWIERFKEVPVIKENLPNRDRLAAYFKRRREVALASP
ncbi:Glutathione S-transferase [Macleaya cordata]|uniref:glutathione transferase n=1 Tax=Macleaya cordata TaxID=56857 RepID=A0A200PVK9_MACCD|nr:Glutathione S-transferase [Macleaya cordata]